MHEWEGPSKQEEEGKLTLKLAIHVIYVSKKGQ